MTTEKECRRLVRRFQENLVAKRPSGFYDSYVSDTARSELRNRRWWPPRSAGRFTIPPCIYAERLSVAFTRHAHPLNQTVLMAETGPRRSRGESVLYEVLNTLVELGYLARDKITRGHEYRLLRPFKAPLYRPRDGQAPWWEVLEEPERRVVTIGMATAHGPEHWKRTG